MFSNYEMIPQVKNTLFVSTSRSQNKAEYVEKGDMRAITAVTWKKNQRRYVLSAGVTVWGLLCLCWEE